jgi:hypothetical protein
MHSVKISGAQPRANELEDKTRDSPAWLGVRCIFLLDFILVYPIYLDCSLNTESSGFLLQFVFLGKRALYDQREAHRLDSRTPNPMLMRKMFASRPYCRNRESLGGRRDDPADVYGHGIRLLAIGL